MQSKCLFKKISILLSIIFVTGCTRSKIPEGPIKDFIYNFDFEKAYNGIDNAILHSESIDYKNDIQVGRYDLDFKISKENGNLYYHWKATFTGSYVISSTYLIEKLGYLDESGNVYYAEKENENVINYSKSENDLQSMVDTFFYAENQDGYYTGGQYYGDVIYATGIKYYMNFSLTDDNLLQYKLENDLSGQGKVFNQIYTVNSLGMLVDYHFDGRYLEEKLEVVSNIYTTYNENFDDDKIKEL